MCDNFLSVLVAVFGITTARTPHKREKSWTTIDLHYSFIFANLYINYIERREVRWIEKNNNLYMGKMKINMTRTLIIMLLSPVDLVTHNRCRGAFDYSTNESIFTFWLQNRRKKKQQTQRWFGKSSSDAQSILFWNDCWFFF